MFIQIISKYEPIGALKLTFLGAKRGVKKKEV
jgi:hypothetical protein